jgi:hypothetical protein
VANLRHRLIEHGEQGRLESPVLVVGKPHDLAGNVAVPFRSRPVPRPIQQDRVNDDCDRRSLADEREQLGGSHMRLV